MMKKILLLLVVAFASLACDQKAVGLSAAQAFVENNTLYGVYTNGKQSFVFDENKHQQCISRNSYRLQSDDQAVILNIALSRVPTKLGEQTSVSISVKRIAGVKSGQMMFVLEKSESGLLWFWNETDKMGIVVPSTINM